MTKCPNFKWKQECLCTTASGAEKCMSVSQVSNLTLFPMTVNVLLTQCYYLHPSMSRDKDWVIATVDAVSSLVPVPLVSTSL